MQLSCIVFEITQAILGLRASSCSGKGSPLFPCVSPANEAFTWQRTENGIGESRANVSCHVPDHKSKEDIPLHAKYLFYNILAYTAPRHRCLHNYIYLLIIYK